MHLTISRLGHSNVMRHDEEKYMREHLNTPLKVDCIWWYDTGEVAHICVDYRESIITIFDTDGTVGILHNDKEAWDMWKIPRPVLHLTEPPKTATRARRGKWYQNLPVTSLDCDSIYAGRRLLIGNLHGTITVGDLTYAAEDFRSI